MNLDQIIEQLRALNIRLAVQFVEGKTEGRCYHAQYWAVLSEYPMEREEIADMPCFRGGAGTPRQRPHREERRHGTVLGLVRANSGGFERLTKGRMTIDEMIAVLQGAKEGKQVQLKVSLDSGAGWVDVPRPDWDFNTYDYRIKPEPREFWINYRKRFAYDSKMAAEVNASSRDDLIIHVREVLD